MCARGWARRSPRTAVHRNSGGGCCVLSRSSLRRAFVQTGRRGLGATGGFARSGLRSFRATTCHGLGRSMPAARSPNRSLGFHTALWARNVGLNPTTRVSTLRALINDARKASAAGYKVQPEKRRKENPKREFEVEPRPPNCPLLSRSVRRTPSRPPDGRTADSRKVGDATPATTWIDVERDSSPPQIKRRAPTRPVAKHPPQATDPRHSNQEYRRQSETPRETPDLCRAGPHFVECSERDRTR